MSEPISGSVAGAAGWKIIGGTAGALGIGAACASVVVMLMTLPKNGREWAVGLISTVIGSIAGGAYVIIKLGLLQGIQTAPDLFSLFFALCSILGIAFACGLPAWAVVRWVFAYIEKQRGKDIVEVAREIKAEL